LERSLLRAHLFFARTFLKHPVMLGSLIPSSPSLVRKLSRQIDWQNTRVLVEYGPGVGTVTTALLQRLRPDGVLVAIDYNQDFATYLRKTVTDPRLRVAHGSAADVEKILADMQLDGADCVVSGIPHSTLTPELRARILQSTRQVLRPGGSFIVYQFTAAVLPQLEEVFGEVRQERELMNILPARIFCCSR
jgi:phospholipid N-methyltransferase